MNKPLLILCLSFIANSAWTQTSGYQFESVVTEKPFNSSSRRVITRDEIRRSGATNLPQLLTQTAGLSVINGAFVPNTIFLRGGDAGHVLVLIDGFPVYDAISDKRSFNLNSINLASVQKIEIVKGSQTTLYGGQALSGVIKIETLSRSTPSKSTTAKVNAGHLSTLQGYLDYRKNLGGSIPQLGGFYQSKTNPSPVKDSTYTYPERQAVVEGSWVYPVEGSGTVVVRARNFDEQRNIINRSTDALDFLAKNGHQLFGLSFLSDKNSYLPSISAAYVNSLRSYYHPVNALNAQEFNQSYYGQTTYVRLEQPVLRGDDMGLTVGASYAREVGKIDNVKGQNPTFNGRVLNVEQELYGVFTQGAVQLGAGWELGAGIRWEKLPTTEGASSQLGLSYAGWKLELSEGLKAPTLFNLYDFQYGNPLLKPERARTASLEKRWGIGERSAVSLTGFYSSYADLIEAQFSGGSLKYQNVAQAEVTGAEFFGEFQMLDDTLWTMTAMYQNPLNKLTDTRLIRRPYTIITTQVSQQWNSAWSTYVSYLFNGERTDYGATQTIRVTLPSYSLVGLGGRYQASENLQFELKVNNLLSTRYEESYGFWSEGFFALLGAEYQF